MRQKCLHKQISLDQLLLKRRQWRFLRRPKTMQERRAGEMISTDPEMQAFGIRVRAKRNLINLPDTRTDKHLSRCVPWTQMYRGQTAHAFSKMVRYLLSCNVSKGAK